MGFWNFFFASKPNYQADPLYCAIADAGRNPELYDNLATPNTIDGRFDMLVLHLYLVQRRLRELGEAGRAQTLFDLFFQQMDDNLREMGVGDINVGKRIRKMAEAYYGRARAYEDALKMGREGKNAAALESALTRNLYPNAANPPPLTALTAHILEQNAVLSRRSLAELEAGNLN